MSNPKREPFVLNDATTRERDRLMRDWLASTSFDQELSDAEIVELTDRDSDRDD